MKSIKFQVFATLYGNSYFLMFFSLRLVFIKLYYEAMSFDSSKPGNDDIQQLTTQTRD